MAPIDGMIRKLSLGLLAIALLCSSCGDGTAPADPDLAIELRWLASYDRESRSDVETGLLWTLSFLGAALPATGENPLRWHRNTVTLRLDRAGIDEAALPIWRRLVRALKASEEYRIMGALDAGRFAALTLCSSNHYYALTGADPHYDDAHARHVFDPERVAIVESAVSHGHRLVEIANGPAAADIAFVAQPDLLR